MGSECSLYHLVYMKNCRPKLDFTGATGHSSFQQGRGRMAI
ncbi:hypothetical protein HMPREF9374_0643 [Desmospora sp. 8437]|nr:hypothetical protein HMPREF9374_0643 [Desmospora sp. 8437]